MATFFPPPPPFVGGTQPFANHNGNVPAEAVRVDNPPPSHAGRTVAAIVAAALAWQPVQLPPPTARALSPALFGPSVVVDNPPIGGSIAQDATLQAVLASWQPSAPNAYLGNRQQLQPKALPPSLLDVRVDTPPFGGSAAQDQQFLVKWLAWQPPAPNANFGAGQPLQPKTLPPSLLDVRVDNPPGLVDQPNAANWQITSPLPTLPAGSAAWNVPAASQPFSSLQASILLAWQTSYTTTTLPRNLAPSLLDVRVDNPPPGGNPYNDPPLQVSLAAWQPPPPNAYFGSSQALQPKALAPSLLDVRVDNPPGLRSALSWSFWQTDVPVQQRNARLVIVPDTFVASSDAQLTTILSSWQPAEFRLVVARNLPPSLLDVRVDNPPGLLIQPSASNWQTAAAVELPPLSAAWNIPSVPASAQPFNALPLSILAAWATPTYAPIVARNLPPALTAVRVDNPPGLVARVFWSSADTTTTQPRALSAAFLTAAPGQQPPRGLPAANMTAWYDIPVAPTLSRHLAPSLLDVRVDNPPPLNRAQLLNTTAWQTSVSAPITGTKSLAWATVSQFVPSNRQPSTIAASWVSTDLAPTLPRKLSPQITAVRVDNPPLRSQAQLTSITVAWSASDVPQQPRAKSIVASANEAQYTGTAAYNRPQFSVVLHAWRPAEYSTDNGRSHVQLASIAPIAHADVRQWLIMSEEVRNLSLKTSHRVATLQLDARTLPLHRTGSST